MTKPKFPTPTLVARTLAVVVAAFAIVVTSLFTAADPAAATNSLSGSCMGAGQSLQSTNHEYTLAMQGDGNLVIYALGKAIWSTGTYGHPGARTCMQTDGNLVVYLASTPLWSSRTGAHAAAAYFLAMQDDSNLVIYSPSRTALWASGVRPLAGDAFVVRSHGLCLDAAANATFANGDRVTLWGCWGGRNQQWVRVGNEIVNQGAGLCLDANAGGVWNNGDTIQLWGCNGGANQQWTEQGLWLVNQASHKCLDAAAESDFADGGKVQLWDCVSPGNLNQEWLQGNEVVSQARGLCLDADAGGLAYNGDRVQLWSCNHNTNQQWVRQNDRLINVAANKCLDADGASNGSNGGKVQLWACSTVANGNQGWQQQGDALRNEAHGKCLDAAAGTVGNNGGAVEVWDCYDRATNQGWLNRDDHGPDYYSFALNVGLPGGGPSVSWSVQIAADTTVFATYSTNVGISFSPGTNVATAYAYVGNKGTASTANIDRFIDGFTYYGGGTIQLGPFTWGDASISSPGGAPGYQSGKETFASGFGIGISGSVGASCSINLGRNFGGLGRYAPNGGGWPVGSTPSPSFSTLQSAIGAASSKVGNFPYTSCPG